MMNDKKVCLKSGTPKCDQSITCAHGRGKLSVPFDRLNEFYDVYINAVKSGKIYVVEQKSETYNFFVDIDYKIQNPWESMTFGYF